MKTGYNLEARKRESLFSDFVTKEQKQRLEKAKTIQSTIATWNDFNAKHGSFADEYSSL